MELGIDIGDIDVVLLIGPPGSNASPVQRTGRGGRRRPEIDVVCVYRTPLEQLLFRALLNMSEASSPTAFCPSVAVQQIFSLLKQSPTVALRLGSLAELFEGLLRVADLEALLGELQAAGYLSPGRAGEWRAGERLKHLVDLQSLENTPLSLYSNLQTSNGTPIKIRDQHTQRVVAQVERQWLSHDRLILEGRQLQITWQDGESLWVTLPPKQDTGAYLRYRSARQVLSYAVTHQLPAQVGLPPEAAPLIPVADGWLWYHWLGEVYGRAVLDLMGYTLSVRETTQPGLCLWLDHELAAIPIWPPNQIQRTPFYPGNGDAAVGAIPRNAGRAAAKFIVMMCFYL